MVAEDSSVAALRDRLVGSYLVGTDGIHYHLREVIGEGGQGWVYKANYDEPDGMWVVVKILRPDSVTEETLGRFRREADVLRMLGAHATPTPNVVRFYDHGVAMVSRPGTSHDQVQMPFTVMEFVDGVTFAAVLEGPPKRGLPVERVRRVLRQVVRALETVHAHRVVHRDLKPSNILLTMQGSTEVAKVTDFGLAKLVDLKLTQTASVAGASLGYAPPEQYEQGNGRVSARTDVFSLAAVLFEALSGREAFPYHDGENPLRVISRLLTGERPCLVSAGSLLAPELVGQADLIAALDREIHNATQADPDGRHANCREFWDQVEPILKTAAQRAEACPPRAVTLACEGGSEQQAWPDVTTDPNRWSVQGAQARKKVDLSAPVVRVLCASEPGFQLRTALIGGDGSAIAAGRSGFARWDGTKWSALQLPAGVEPRTLRGMARTPSNQIVVFGERGLLALLAANGVAEPLTSPLTDLTFRGAWCDGERTVTAVGERLSRPAGAIVQLERGEPPRIRFLDWTPRLCAVLRIAGGELIACGDAGALVQIDRVGYNPIPWDRTGHLCGIAQRMDGGLSVVGTGGHALSVTNRLSVQLESVQTTRDLLSVSIGADGSMWAAGEAGRLLRRSRGIWERVPTDGSITSRLFAVGPTHDGVLVLGDNGLVMEVRPRTQPA